MAITFFGYNNKIQTDLDIPKSRQRDDPLFLITFLSSSLTIFPLLILRVDRPPSQHLQESDASNLGELRDNITIPRSPLDANQDSH